MKLLLTAVLPSLLLVAQCTARDTVFGDMRALLDLAESKANGLVRDMALKQLEVDNLIEQLEACIGGCTPSQLTPAPFLMEPEPTPTPQQSGTEKAPSMPTFEPDQPERTPPSPSGGWTPKVGDSWNYNLDSPVDTNAKVDVFFIDMDYAQDTIDELHSKGKWVSCYVSVGTVESWRNDADDFPSAAIGNSWKDWKGEKWLDITNEGVQHVMEARVKTAASMGCDAIEPDNMMGYMENNTGVEVSESDQIKYNKWFANMVHSNGMLVGLKNAVELVDILHEYYDFALNEECHQWDECDVYTDTFIAMGKPVFNVEYKNSLDVCDENITEGLEIIVKNYKLGPAMCSCNDPSRDLDCKDVV